MATRGLTLPVALRLGRISNVPTVWSNVLVGVAVAGSLATPQAIVVLAIGCSLLYVAGMFLNDAFDRAIDARERPERPIPAGIVSARDVFVAGGVLMGSGWIVILWASSFGGQASIVRAGLASALLVASIVLYDSWHKGNVVGPAIMAMCRVLVYVTAALAIAPVPTRHLAVASIVLFAYLVGLTYIAKHERSAGIARAWPLVVLALPVVYALRVAFERVYVAIAAAAFLAWLGYALSFLVFPGRFAPARGVVALIAGISLLDAVIVAAAGRYELAAFAVAAWALTRYLQRYVPGT